MSASPSTDKASTSQMEESSRSPMATGSSTSNSDRLANLENEMDMLLVRVSRYAGFSDKQERRLNDIDALLRGLDDIAHGLRRDLDDHCTTDNKWWRKAIDAIVNDIDELRASPNDTPSGASGTRLPVAG